MGQTFGTLWFAAPIRKNGWPYLQHRGGPKGFLKVLNSRTLAFADCPQSDRTADGLFDDPIVAPDLPCARLKARFPQQSVVGPLAGEISIHQNSCDEFPIPAQNRIGLRCSGHFLQGLSSQPVSDLRQGGFSSCESNSRPLIWAFRMRFSAARHSFRNRSSWSTVLVTESSSCGQIIWTLSDRIDRVGEGGL